MSEHSVRIATIGNKNTSFELGGPDQPVTITIPSPGPTPLPIRAAGMVMVPGNTILCSLRGACNEDKQVQAQGNSWEVTFTCTAFGRYHLSVTAIGRPEPPAQVGFMVMLTPE